MGSSGTGMTLAQALARIAELEDEIDTKVVNQNLLDNFEEAVSNPNEHTCQRCYRVFYSLGDQRFCPRDCKEFRKQEPFETLWKQLHPNGSREPSRVVAVRMS